MREQTNTLKPSTPQKQQVRSADEYRHVPLGFLPGASTPQKPEEKKDDNERD